MAKQLYDYWFVQFDFPNEEGKPYKSSGGEMVWNEKLKREIPIDWEVLSLFDAVSVQYGFPFATEQFTEEETNVPVVRIRDILEGTTSAYSLEKADEKYHLNENDVLVGMDGNFHMNFWHDNIAYLNQRCVRLRAHSDSTISSIQILHSIKPYIKAKEQNAKGSTVGHLSDKDLKGLYLIKPLKTRAFNPRKTLDGLLALVIENKKQILSLTKQRDELLPLLINGQITIESMARILYKYLDITGAKCMIGNQNLQFTNASQLNDPFDCHPKLLDYSSVPERKLQGWIPEEWWKMKEENDALNLRNETWLCSLSKINDSILMWAHYCYNHKGICIGLDLDKIMESVPPMFGSIYIKPIVLDVQYYNIIERPSAYNSAQDIFNYQWQTKAKEWEYEQEVRLVMPKPSSIYATLTPAQAKHPKEIWDWREIHHYMPLKGECFESIYFGVNIDEQEKEKIIQFVRKKLNPHINLYQMCVNADAFRLQPEFIKPLNSDLSDD